MSTSDPVHEKEGHEAPEAQIPAHEGLEGCGEHVGSSLDPRRIFWTLNDPLETSVWILDDHESPKSIEPYYQPPTDGSTGSNWHPASKAPISGRDVSSITVRIESLDSWEDDWLDYHMEHSESDWSEEDKRKAGAQYGELRDYDPDEDEDEEAGHLLMCCGSERPRGKAVSVVVTAAATGEGFVTVHDYLSTVHPWLLSIRSDILGSIGVYDDDPLPEDTKLTVTCYVDKLFIEGQTKSARIRSRKLDEISVLLGVEVI